MKVKIGLLLWLFVVAVGCTKQDVQDLSLAEMPSEAQEKTDVAVQELSAINNATDNNEKGAIVKEFSLIKAPSGLGFEEIGNNRYSFLIDDSVTSFDDLVRYEITNPRFKDEFIAKENAEFPFDETYKKKFREALLEISRSSQYFFLPSVGLDKAKKMINLRSYNIKTKEPKFFEFSDIESDYTGIEITNFEFYARENPAIIDGILCTTSIVTHNYGDKKLYAETLVYYFDIEYDELSRVKSLHNGTTSFDFNYIGEDIIEFITNSDVIKSRTFNAKTHEYTFGDETYSYKSIKPNEQYFEEIETPHGMFLYNCLLYSYDEVGRLKVFADCSYDTPGIEKLSGLQWSRVFLIEY